MAADKGESGSVQAGETAKQTKKPRAAPKKKTQSLAEKTVAEAKAAYIDIDLSEGRSLRKRAAAPTSGATKERASKKPAPKKAAAAPKKAKGSDETKDTKASAAKAE